MVSSHGLSVRDIFTFFSSFFWIGLLPQNPDSCGYNMSISNTLPSGLKEVDVIIAGGGTSGLVVASRISDALPELSILVIEGGRNNQGDPSITYPVLFLSHLMPTSNATLFYHGKKESSLNDRAITVPSGGILGGGSSINLLTYSRAQRQDLDSWNTPGWSARDLVPYLKRLETFHGDSELKRDDPGYTHGHNGPVQVSNSRFNVVKSQKQFVQVAEQLGYKFKKDIQDLDSDNATQHNMRYISPEGIRQDAATTYLIPRIKDGRHPNLHVLTEHQVARVLFEGNRAVGVEFSPNPTFSKTKATYQVKARKLVVVSSGALGTPLILERSGVGDPEVLKKAGVDVVAKVYGVGKNYMDHHLFTYPYWSDLQANETVDAIYGGREDPAQLIGQDAAILGWNAADVTAKLRPSDAEAAALGPAFEAAWQKDFKHVPNKPIAIFTTLNGFPGDPTGLPVTQFMSISTFTVYPYSRGYIHITGADVGAPVDFKTGFLDDAEGVDIKKAVWAYKKQREMLRRMDVYRGEYESWHPPFPAHSKAANKKYDAPLKNVKNIEYSAEDDAIIEKWLRQNVGTTWHSMGTCKMAPLAKGGVVDPSLSVHGVKNLKIADLSIPPENVAANTGNTAFMVGEKAADIFIRELLFGEDGEDRLS